MPISSLIITNFRNLPSANLTPSTHSLNIISGNNGSGKTSILEAIHYLSLARSFRNIAPARLIKHQADKFSLFSQILIDDRMLTIGAERDTTGTTRIRIAEKEAASSLELTT